jgi:AcrR family transcriptional regulator
MPRGRPREFDSEKALDTALLLFWRQGYEGTSLAALTAAIGINMPSLYAAFGNKEELFKKVLDRYIQKPASYLPNALHEPTARGAAETLMRGAIHMVMNRDHPDGCLLVQGALASGPLAESARNELSRRRAGAEAAVRRRFERAIAEGDLGRSVDPAKLARYIITVVWGMSVQAAGGATRAQLKEVAEMAMRSWPTSPAPKIAPVKKGMAAPRATESGDRRPPGS